MRIYLDSNILIHAVEGATAAADACRTVLGRTDAAEFVTSELALGEVLVGAFRRADAELVRAYSDWFSLLGGLHVRSVDRQVLVRAAGLRATKPTIRMPDAIHAATSELEGCDVFFSDDRKLIAFPGQSSRSATIDDVPELLQAFEGSNG